MIMLLSNSILRRYTPPTCTLQIVAKSSPLSRWMGQSVVNKLRFELRFDDPRQSEDKQVTIRGDRAELEVLSEAVNSYIQDFLDQSQTQLPIAGIPPATTADLGTNNNSDQESRDVNPTVSTPEEASEEKLSDPQLSTANSPQEPEPRLSPPKPRSLFQEIYLQQKGLLSHNLFLGQLATDKSGPVVDLSVLQLFDLATALDEYATELVALPNLSHLSSQKVTSAWTRVAVVLLLAVGTTAVGLKLLEQPEPKQEASVPIQEPDSSPIAQTPPITLATPEPTPLPTPVLPTPLASSSNLPPPSPVAIPNPPTPGVAPVPLSPNPGVGSSPTSITIQPESTAPEVVKSKARSVPTTSSQRTSPSPSPNVKTGKSQTAVPTTPPLLPDLPSLQPNSSSEVTGQVVRQKLPQEPTTPQPRINLPTLKPDFFPDPAAETPAGETFTNSSLAEWKQSTSITNSPTASSTLFDHIPQVAEVRNYFQQRWRPPNDLKQTLEYSLLLNADGSIQRIIPRGKAAGEYIDRVDLPLVGEPFVSTVEGGQNPKIRVLFTPEGKVQTFVEEMN